MFNFIASSNGMKEEKAINFFEKEMQNNLAFTFKQTVSLSLIVILLIGRQRLK